MSACLLYASRSSAANSCTHILAAHLEHGDEHTRVHRPPLSEAPSGGPQRPRIAQRSFTKTSRTAASKPSPLCLLAGSCLPARMSGPWYRVLVNKTRDPQSRTVRVRTCWSSKAMALISATCPKACPEKRMGRLRSKPVPACSFFSSKLQRRHIAKTSAAARRARSCGERRLSWLRPVPSSACSTTLQRPCSETMVVCPGMSGSNLRPSAVIT